MNFRLQSLERSLSTEKGSAGIEFVLWTFLMIALLWMPLFSFLFEKFNYSAEANKWAAILDNSLDALEWQLDTGKLSTAERGVSEEAVTLFLNKTIDTYGRQKTGQEWQLISCDYLSESESGTNQPLIRIQMSVKYPPATYVGHMLTGADKILLTLERERELPYDR